MAPTPVLLPGKSHGWRSLVGCRLWGRTESDTTEVTWQQQQHHEVTDAWRCGCMSSRVQIRDPMTAAHQASLSITNPQGSPKPMSIESVMPSNHLILCIPLSSCPQSFPASGSFQMSQLFTSGGQNIGVSASASVLPMNTQD